MAVVCFWEFAIILPHKGESISKTQKGFYGFYYPLTAVYVCADVFVWVRQNRASGVKRKKKKSRHWLGNGTVAQCQLAQSTLSHYQMDSHMHRPHMTTLVDARNIHQRALVGMLKTLVLYLKGIQHYKKIQVHTVIHIVGTQWSWTDCLSSKSSIFPVIYPKYTHHRSAEAVGPGAMPCGLVSPDRHIKIQHTWYCISRIVMGWSVNPARRQAGAVSLGHAACC